MMLPDLINALFEFGGGLLILLLNVRRLIKDKCIKGVHWGPTAFFSIWGAWNLFYYPHLNQWWSFAGGVFVTGANTLWLGLLIYYTLQRRNQ